MIDHALMAGDCASIEAEPMMAAIGVCSSCDTEPINASRKTSACSRILRLPHGGGHAAGNGRNDDKQHDVGDLRGTVNAQTVERRVEEIGRRGDAGNPGDQRGNGAPAQ